MGTRNLITVVSDGLIKVRQYCQWDGYPTGQGADIARFLQSADLKVFQDKVNKLVFLPNEFVLYKINNLLKHDNEWITFAEGKKITRYYPAFSRDTGAKLLGLIQSGRVKEVQDWGPAEESDGEYEYTIDLDKQTVTVLHGSKRIGKYKFSEFTVEAMKQLEEKSEGVA